MKYLKSKRVQHWALVIIAAAGTVFEVYRHGDPITVGVVLSALLAQLNRLGAAKEETPSS